MRINTTDAPPPKLSNILTRQKEGEQRSLSVCGGRIIYSLPPNLSFAWFEIGLINKMGSNDL